MAIQTIPHPCCEWVSRWLPNIVPSLRWCIRPGCAVGVTRAIALAHRANNSGANVPMPVPWLAMVPHFPSHSSWCPTGSCLPRLQGIFLDVDRPRCPPDQHLRSSPAACIPPASCDWGHWAITGHLHTLPPDPCQGGPALGCRRPVTAQDLSPSGMVRMVPTNGLRQSEAVCWRLVASWS